MAEQKSEMDVQDIKIMDIKHFENSRFEIKNLDQLMRDIEQHGLRHPIGVFKDKAGEYVLIFGNRRLAAYKKLGKQKIPAHIFDDMDINAAMMHNLGENLHRENISPAELGRICDRFIKYELNVSEISARLSISKSAIQRALDIYHGLSEKDRNKVAYYGAGRNKKTGDVSTTVAGKIISMKKQYALSEPTKEKLFKIAKTEELSISQINLLSKFLEAGYGVTEALAGLKEYRALKFDVILSNRDIDAMLIKYKLDSTIILLQLVLYGILPPLKKPDFIRLRQMPDLKK